MGEFMDMWNSESRFSSASGQDLPYVVLQVTLKEKFFGTGSGNLTDLEEVINRQVAKGYRLHTMSTSNGGSKGFAGGDRIQATLVFERLDLANALFRAAPVQETPNASQSPDKDNKTEKVQQVLSEDAHELRAFYASVENVTSAIELKKKWQESGFSDHAELTNLTEQIGKAARSERFYGRDQKDIKAILAAMHALIE